MGTLFEERYAKGIKIFCLHPQGNEVPAPPTSTYVFQIKIRCPEGKNSPSFVFSVRLLLQTSKNHSPGRSLEDAGYNDIEGFTNLSLSIIDDDHRSIVQVGYPCPISFPSLRIFTLISSPGRTTGLREFANSLIFNTSIP